MVSCNNNDFCKRIYCFGPTGPMGPTGPAGGPTGPTGPAGTSVRILGSYDNYDDLVKEHPKGNINDSYLVLNDLYVWSDNTGSWVRTGEIKGPKGDIGPQGIEGKQGLIGPTGPAGPMGVNSTKNVYLVTFNDGTNVDGILVKSNSALPINRKELDIYQLINLDTSKNTIQFNEIGYYKITIISSLYLKKDSTFNPDTDFITLGFKVTNADDVYIGASEWRNDENARQIVMHGVIAVNNLDEQYELVNLGNKDIYLNSPDLTNIKSDSYFTNSLVTIIIEYMGR